MRYRMNAKSRVAVDGEKFRFICLLSTCCDAQWGCDSKFHLKLWGGREGGRWGILNVTVIHLLRRRISYQHIGMKIKFKINNIVLRSGLNRRGDRQN